jgi:hypothetical protein
MLGKAQPYALGVELGASDNTLDLVDCPLHVYRSNRCGQSGCELSTANPQPMSLLRIEAGATGWRCATSPMPTSPT